MSIKFKKIPMPKIKRAALKMAEAVRPERIILFGSYAYGNPTFDSDVDFLLVVRQKSWRLRDRIYLKASGALTPRPFPIDLVVRNQSDIDWRVKAGDFFLQDIIEKGRVLYER